MLTRICFSKFKTALSAIFLFGAVISTVEAQTPRPKNIILILADDMGWDIAALGHPHVKTPHLDRMVAEGRTFQNFYVAAPVCSPTRASFLTGQFPARFGISLFIGTEIQNRRRNIPNFLEPKSTTIADLAQQAGCRTGHIGKWHLDSGTTRIAPSEWGFDVFNPPSSASSLDGRSQSSEILALRAIEFMNEAVDRPFYLNLWLFHMHRPVVSNAEQRALYEGETFPPEDFEPMMADYASKASNAHERFLEYNAVIPSVDNAVGMILDYLDRNGLSEDTLVLFTSDNGPEDHRFNIANVPGMGNTGPFRARKRSIYEGGIRMPCIARWPSSIPEGTTDSSSVVSSVDWLPSIASLLGRPVPPVLDGEDKSQVLLGTPSVRSKPLIFEFSRRAYSDFFSAPQYAIRDGKWKFFWEEEIEVPELYDLVNDPGEKVNLVAQYPDVAADLQQKIEAFDAERVKNPPVILNDLPSEIIGFEGDNVTLSVEAIGTPPPYYQWYRDDVALVDNANVLGSTTSVLQIVDANLAESGVYHCVAENSQGAARTNDCVFQIQFAPEILVQPAVVSVKEGDTVCFKVSVKASKPISYQWLLNDVPLEDGFGVSGSQTEALALSELTAPISVLASEGYSCRISNPLGNIESDKVGLEVSEFIPVITAQPRPVYAFEGNDAEFEVIAIGSGTVFYQWYLDGIVLEDTDVFSGTRTPKLVVSALPAPTIIPEKDGFTCHVTNRLSTVVSDSAGLVIESFEDSNYDNWAQHTMGTGEDVGSPLSDYDNDGLVNLLEFATLSNPTVRNYEPFLDIRVTKEDQTQIELIEISYRRWVGGNQTDGFQYHAGNLNYELKTFNGTSWVSINHSPYRVSAVQDSGSSTEEAVYSIRQDAFPPDGLLRMEVSLDQ